MPSLDELLAALTGRRPVAQDDPVRGYTPPSDPLAAPPPYAPSPWEAAAMRQRNAVRPPAGRQEGSLSQLIPTPGELAQTAQSFHEGDAAFRETLPGKIAQGVLAMPHVMADLPRAVVNTSLVQPIRKGAELMARAAGGEDVTTNPQDVGEAFGAANVAMGGAAPFAPKGALGAAGGKLVIPAAERTAGTTSAPFYSAVDNALSNAKLEKAPLDQWHNYLKTQPNVKAEELNQLGLNPSSSGFGPNSLTKAQLQEHLDANRVQLKEVTKKGGEPITPATIGRRADEIMREEHPDVQSDAPNYYSLLDAAHNRAEQEMNQNRPGRVEPVWYADYQLSGASNYGETLLTLPSQAGIKPKEGFSSTEAARDWYTLSSKDYHSPHWDEPNVLVHVRYNDRAVPAPNGEGTVPSLHLEEVQSDWHQAGRKQGYQTDKTEKDMPLTAKNENGYWEVRGPNDRFITNVTNPGTNEQQAIAIARQRIEANDPHRIARDNRVPDAPFKDTWPDLALKRMLHKAATETNADGTPKYHALSWTPGEAQAARYDLSKHMDKVQYSPSDAGGRLIGVKNGQVVVNKDGIAPEKLEQHIGKDAAEKLLSVEPSSTPFGAERGSDGKTRNANWTANLNGVHEISGDDLKVGGSGMREFYDKMLVNKANALGKKFGTRVGQNNLQTQSRAMRAGPEDWRVVGEDGKGLKDARGEPYSFKTEEAAQKVVKNRQGPQVHVLPITPELRQAAARGFPLFSMGLALPGAAPLDDRAAKALATKPPGAQELTPGLPPPQPNPAFNQAVEHQRRWGSPDAATQLGDIAAKTGQVAVSPISAVKGLYDKVEAADAAARNPSLSSDAYADPNAMAKDSDVPATALGLMGAGVPFSKQGAFGMAGGKGVRWSPELHDKLVSKGYQPGSFNAFFGDPVHEYWDPKNKKWHQVEPSIDHVEEKKAGLQLAGSTPPEEFEKVGVPKGLGLDKSIQTKPQFQDLAKRSLNGDLTAEMKDALETYKESGLENISYDLRQGNKPKPHDRKTIEALDKMLANSSLAQDVTAYRVVDKDTYQKALDTGRYHDKAFVSTTTNPKSMLSADDYTFEGGKLMRVYLPKGTQALPIAHLDTPSLHEKEILVNRNVPFSVTMDKDGLPALRPVQSLNDTAIKALATKPPDVGQYR